MILAKELVSLLLEKDPARRLTAKQALTHPWMLGTSSRQSTDTSGRETPPALMSMSSDSSEEELIIRKDTNMLRLSLNRAIDAQRDGVHLKSVSESSLWRRRKGRHMEDNEGTAEAGGDGNEGGDMQVELGGSGIPLWTSE